MNILYSYKGNLNKQLETSNHVTENEISKLDAVIFLLFQRYRNIGNLTKEELNGYLDMISDQDKQTVSRENIKKLAVLAKIAQENSNGYFRYTKAQSRDMQKFIWSLVRRKKMMESQLKEDNENKVYLEKEINNCDILLAKFNKFDGNHIIEDPSYLTTITNAFDNIELPAVKRLLFLKDIVRAEKDIFEAKTDDGNNLNYDNYDVSLTFESAKSILARYGINFSNMKIDTQDFLIDNGSESVMIELLDVIKKSPISSYYSFLDDHLDVLAYILCNSSVETLNKMVDISKKYNLDLSKYPKNVFGNEQNKNHKHRRYIRENKSPVDRKRNVSNSDQESLSKPLSATFFKNVELLNQIGIPIDKASEQTICLMPHDILKRNIAISNLYNIGFIKPSTGQYVLTGLLNNNMDVNLDRFIELGLYDYAVENKSSLTSYNELAFRRLKYALDRYDRDSIVKRTNTIKITSAIRKENGFDINYDNVDNYCPICNVHSLDERFLRISNYSNSSYNPDILHHPYISHLEEYKSDDGMAYNIDGVLVSRFKVLRTFNTIINHPRLGINDMEGIVYSIKCNSLWDSDQMNKIDNHIESMFEKGDVNGISKRI